MFVTSVSHQDLSIDLSWPLTSAELSASLKTTGFFNQNIRAKIYQVCHPLMFLFLRYQVCKQGMMHTHIWHHDCIVIVMETRKYLTTDAKHWPTEPPATKYPKAFERSSNNMLLEKTWKIVGRQKPSANPSMILVKMTAWTWEAIAGVMKVAKDQHATAMPRTALPPKRWAALPPSTYRCGKWLQIVINYKTGKFDLYLFEAFRYNAQVCLEAY